MRYLGVPMLLIALGPAAAFAQSGINLAWNDCGPAGAGYESFACDTNLGVSTLVASVVLFDPMPQLNGMLAVIDMQTSASAMSPWWQVGTESCRTGWVTTNFDFTSGPPGCVDPWGGLAVGGVNYATGTNGNPQRARLRGVCAVPGSVSAVTGVEYGLVKFRIDHSKSTGEGSCAGCDDKVCFVLSSVLLTQPAGVGDYTYTIPDWNQVAGWRCPTVLYSEGFGCGFNCATPTRAPNWGTIKSLYR